MPGYKTLAPLALSGFHDCFPSIGCQYFMLYSFSHKFNNQVERAKKKRTEGGMEALGNYRAFIPFYKMGSLLQIL